MMGVQIGFSLTMLEFTCEHTSLGLEHFSQIKIAGLLAQRIGLSFWVLWLVPFQHCECPMHEMI
jgi:hypothetical protein